MLGIGLWSVFREGVGNPRLIPIAAGGGARLYFLVCKSPAKPRREADYEFGQHDLARGGRPASNQNKETTVNKMFRMTALAAAALIGAVGPMHRPHRQARLPQRQKLAC